MLDNSYANQLKKSIEKVLLLAKKHGVTCEVAGNVNLGLSVNIRMQNIDTLEFNNNKKLYITVYVDKNQGTASTTDLTEKSLVATINKAISIAKFTDPDPYAGLADPDLMAKKIIDLDLYHPENIDPSFAINTAKLCEQAAFSASPDITNSDGVMFNYNSSFVAIGNSNDFIGTYPATNYSLSCVAIAEKHGSMQRDGDYTIARNLKNLIKPEIIGAKSAIYATQRLGARKISTCKSKVIFTPEVAAELMGYLVSAIAGNNIANKSSFLLNKLNNRIFPEFINIIDHPLIKQGLKSAAFDSDGLATKKQSIVTNGVLNTYLLNNYFAKKLNLNSTGHASGIHNLFVTDAKCDLNIIEDLYNPINNRSTINKLEKCTNLIEQMENGLIVTETIGHGVNLVTGDYSKGIVGFWVQNRKIVYPVEETTIASNLNYMFTNILGLGSDFNYQSNIITGSILIDDITIAGT